MNIDEDARLGCGAILGLVAIAGAIIFVVSVLAFGWDRIFAPIGEETRRLTHQQSQTYVDGMAVDLDGLCRERRASTDPAELAALEDTIRLRSARYTGELPAHVQRCVEEVR